MSSASKIICHKNNGSGVIKTPVILISVNNDSEVKTVLSQIDPDLTPSVIDKSNIPNDFLQAWVLENGSISIDLTKAKELTKDRLRAERTPLLQAQDVLFQRALESGADTSAIVAEKQRLRDVTTLADQATTLDELRAITVEVTNE